FQSHQFGVRDDEAALRIGGSLVLFGAEDVVDELDDGIDLSRPGQTSCFCLKRSRGRVLVRYLPRQRGVSRRCFLIVAKMFELAGLLPFRLKFTEVANDRG